MKTYNKLVSVLETRIGRTTTTDNNELLEVGHMLFGARFKGVFASGGFPALSASQPYAVVNNKPAATGGEHWLGIARVPHTGRLMVHGSFGRPHATLLGPGSLPPGATRTDPGAEQSVRETNCGQRSLAWLVVFDRLGPAAARLV